MKKLFTLIICLLISSLGFAQLQNGSFEVWDTVSINQPNGWENSNYNAVRKNMLPNVTAFTPSHGGNFAVKLETKSNATDTLFAFVANSKDPFSGNGGVPYSMQPDSVICHAKLGVLTGDSAVFLVIFKKNGSPIGMDMFKVTGNNPTNWQRLSFKLSTLPSAPDSVIIAVASSNAVTNVGVQPGSYVIIDDISFSTVMPIPDGGFEGWNMTTIRAPQKWDCKSANNFAFNGLGNPLVRTTDKYDGEYALKMTTMAAGNNNNFVGINNGYWDNVLMKFTKGFPFTNQIDTLVGWYKYIPKANGTGRVSIELRAAGTSLGQFSATINSNPSYVSFQIPFNLNQAPDTAVIMINTCNTPINLSDTGSVLIIDALKFKSTMNVGIQNFNMGSNLLVGPNPTTGEFSIFYIPKNNNEATYTISDESGKMIKSGLLTGLKTTLNISELPKGIYFIKTYDGNSSASKKLILQ
jgi:hypothetical protein